LLCAAPTAVVMLFVIGWFTRFVDIPMRPLEGSTPEPEPLPDAQLPGLLASFLPIILPVVLISANTIVSTLAKKAGPESAILGVQAYTAVLGNANLAMMISAAIALVVLWRQRRPRRQELSRIVEHALMSAGVIILITSAGGAFGAMLKDARVGDAIQALLSGEASAQLGGTKLLIMGFLVAFLLKFAQGSSTVAMITSSAMLASLVGDAAAIGYHPVYLAAAIGFGAQCGNWMNDSGFWVFTKMGALTEIEGLKSWTFMVGIMTIVGLGFTILFASVLPLV
jgi:GntP family gluconate:H+ symporter